VADRIYVIYTPTGAPGSFHTAIHYERTDPAGKVINHLVIEGKPEMKDLSTPEKALGVVEEAFRTGNVPSRFGRIDAQMRNRGVTDGRDEASDDPNAPYEVIAEGDDLSDHLARIQLFARGFNRAGFVYRGHHQNSNSFAAAALRAGNLPPATGVARDPTGPAGELLEFFAPGLNEPMEPPMGRSPGNNRTTATQGKGSITGGSFPTDGPGDGIVPPTFEPEQPVHHGPVRYLGRTTADRPFDSRFGSWTSSSAGIAPRNPNLPVPPAESGRPLGIFSGKAMPLWATPLPLSGIVNNPSGSSNSGQRWNATPGTGSKYLAPPPQTDGNNPVRYLSRRIVNQPQTSAFDANPPVVPWDDPNFRGGLAGRIAALAGIDPDNPDQPVPPPGGLLALLLAAQR